MKVTFVKASIEMQTDMSIVELGELISKYILGGLKLTGLENRIYEVLEYYLGDRDDIKIFKPQLYKG